MSAINRWIITLFLLFLPFQKQITNNFFLYRRFLWADEIFIVIYVIVFFPILLYHRRLNKTARDFLLALMSLVGIGLLSGMYNGNKFIVTINGIFDYVKHFLIIPVFCMFSVRERDLRALYGTLHRLALIICFVAIAQEVAYLMGFDVYKLGVLKYYVRFGIFRTSSLMGHPNVFGLYALLFFVLDFGVHRRVRWQNIVFAAGAFLSVSRMVWAAFFSVLFLLVLHRKGRKVMGLFILASIVLLLTVSHIYVKTSEEMGSGSFREYTMMKSLNIWSLNPVLGVGPGMYGGVVSFIFNSPVYWKYGFDEYWLSVFRSILSVDQFWPQILAELGIAGALGFALILFVMWRKAQEASLAPSSAWRQNMLFGFTIIPPVMAIYLLGSGLNLGAFLLTFSVLFGLTLGMRNEDIAGQ